ncbi:MAG: alpha/beta-type small acid-soluble spore protein [Firmicutes bacterium]|nr:alpha/beta-type small acid-soluble spore protein [Bacillota bacterium]
MAEGSKSNNKKVVPEAAKVLDQLKYEVANELGIDTSKIQDGYWGELSARECGAVGGHMVRKMIAAAEQALIDQVTADVRRSFRESFEQENKRLQSQAPEELEK